MTIIFTPDATDTVASIAPPVLGYKRVILSSGKQVVVKQSAKLNVNDKVDVAFRDLPWPNQGQTEVIGSLRNPSGEVIRVL